MTNKIGQNVRLKQKDKGSYVTLGIVPTDAGYELRKVVMEGATVLSVDTLKEAVNRAEIMQQMQMEMSKYIMNFNQKESGQ